MIKVHRARCLCGAVTIEVEGPLAPPDVCHCTECRRWSGHQWASTDIARDHVRLSGSMLRWHASSPDVRRGFCGECGSALLWDHRDRGRIAIAMGAFEGPTDVTVAHHIFVGEKGDYYATPNDAPVITTL